jgi:hypothetical protein
MVVLRPVSLRWINGAADDPADLCAHGDVEFRINGDKLIEPTDRDLTVSAAALYLLRTLSVPHSRETPVGDHLFPCCGFSMYDVEGEPDVVICGCPSGEDFEVLHQAGGRGVVVRSGDGQEWAVGWPECDLRSSASPIACPTSTWPARPSSRPPRIRRGLPSLQPSGIDVGGRRAA